METLQAIKFEIMPKGAQKLYVAWFAGSKRLVFNKAIALLVAAYADGQGRISIKRGRRMSKKELFAWYTDDEALHDNFEISTKRTQA